MKQLSHNVFSFRLIDCVQEFLGQDILCFLSFDLGSFGRW